MWNQNEAKIRKQKYHHTSKKRRSLSQTVRRHTTHRQTQTYETMLGTFYALLFDSAFDFSIGESLYVCFFVRFCTEHGELGNEMKHCRALHLKSVRCL